MIHRYWRDSTGAYYADHATQLPPLPDGAVEVTEKEYQREEARVAKAIAAATERAAAATRATSDARSAARADLAALGLSDAAIDALIGDR